MITPPKPLPSPSATPTSIPSTTTPFPTLAQILIYEAESMPWLPYVPDLLQPLAGRYLAAKVKRKYQRCLREHARMEEIIQRYNIQPEPEAE